MKNLIPFFLVAVIAVSTTFTSCTQPKKQEKITYLIPSTQSKDATDAFHQGVMLSDQGDRQKAREALTKAIEADPKLAIAYAWRAANTSNSTEEFVADMAKAKENLDGASQLEKWYYELYETFATSDVNKRIEISQKMVDSFPDIARSHIELGIAYSSQNDEAKARDHYQMAIDMDSAFVGAYTVMANSYLFLEPKDFKKAEQYALKCVTLAPSSPGAEITLGDCYRAENDLDKAREAYAKAVTLDPTSSEAYYKEGHANTFLGNYDEARKNYADGDKHNESVVAASDVIAYTYLYAGDPKTALDALIANVHKADSSTKEKSKIDDAKLQYLSDCERIAMHTGDAAGLKNFMEMTAPLNIAQGDMIGTSEAKLFSAATNLYWQSILAAMEGKYDEATATAEKIKTILAPVNDPNKLDQYHFALGYIAMKQKKYSDAIGHFQESHPNNSVYTQYWLALANEGAGNKDTANAIYQKLAVYNFNSIDYALIRNEVLKKVTPAT